MAGKYTPLFNYLKHIDPHQNEITLSFAKVEDIINDNLPYSAREYTVWWNNEQEGSHVQSHAWMNADWKVDSVDLVREFVKMVRQF